MKLFASKDDNSLDEKNLQIVNDMELVLKHEFNNKYRPKKKSKARDFDQTRVIIFDLIVKYKSADNSEKKSKIFINLLSIKDDLETILNSTLEERLINIKENNKESDSLVEKSKYFFNQLDLEIPGNLKTIVNDHFDITNRITNKIILEKKIDISDPNIDQLDDFLSNQEIERTAFDALYRCLKKSINRFKKSINLFEIDVSQIALEIKNSPNLPSKKHSMLSKKFRNRVKFDAVDDYIYTCIGRFRPKFESIQQVEDDLGDGYVIYFISKYSNLKLILNHIQRTYIEEALDFLKSLQIKKEESNLRKFQTKVISGAIEEVDILEGGAKLKKLSDRILTCFDYLESILKLNQFQVKEFHRDLKRIYQTSQLFNVVTLGNKYNIILDPDDVDQIYQIADNVGFVLEEEKVKVKTTGIGYKFQQTQDNDQEKSNTDIIDEYTAKISLFTAEDLTSLFDALGYTMSNHISLQKQFDKYMGKGSTYQHTNLGKLMRFLRYPDLGWHRLSKDLDKMIFSGGSAVRIVKRDNVIENLLDHRTYDRVYGDIAFGKGK